MPHLRPLRQPLALVLLLVLALAPLAAAQEVERLVIVQGSVGQPGRERAYLNFHNAEQVDVTVTVQYARPKPAAPILRTYVIPAEDRLSVELAVDVPGLPASYFSVIAIAEAADALPAAVDMRLTWHRNPDGREVETLTAVTRRTPKR
jgi:hypothetical protein